MRAHRLRESTPNRSSRSKKSRSRSSFEQNDDEDYHDRHPRPPPPLLSCLPCLSDRNLSPPSLPPPVFNDHPPSHVDRPLALTSYGGTAVVVRDEVDVDWDDGKASKKRRTCFPSGSAENVVVVKKQRIQVFVRRPFCLFHFFLFRSRH